ncbi:unnamed protein product [Brassica oleracea]
MCFGDDKFKPTFSSSKTWSQTCTHHQSVNWSKIVWFAQKIPRFSFINCLTFKDRLSTVWTELVGYIYLGIESQYKLDHHSLHSPLAAV